jgi:hypothetical protein
VEIGATWADVDEEADFVALAKRRSEVAPPGRPREVCRRVDALLARIKFDGGCGGEQPNY